MVISIIPCQHIRLPAALPLYQYSHVGMLRNTLKSVLYPGTIWKCVPLLDEGDVFLKERTQAALQHNALLSVLLRVLEYYKRVLILTFN